MNALELPDLYASTAKVGDSFGIGVSQLKREQEKDRIFEFIELTRQNAEALHKWLGDVLAEDVK